MQKILILGGSGLIGTAILNEINKYKEFQYYTTYYENAMSLSEGRSFKMNIEDLDEIGNVLKAINPNSIVSCLRGDFNKQLILHIKIAEYLKENGGRLYFFSTVNVFDNDLSKPHYEDDLPNSHTDYGQFKLDCEKRIVDILQDNACILRLPQVWGKNSPRMNELLNALQNCKNIVVYPKFFYNTNTDMMIAEQLCYIMNNDLKGIFHLAAEDVVDYKNFYNELVLGLGFNNAKIEESFEQEGYFALLSKRNNEFPEQLRLTNESVIDYLVKRVS